MKAISSGNYRKLYGVIRAYSLIDIAFVAKVQTGHLHRKPHKDTNDEGYDVDDVELEDPQFVYDRSEDDDQVEYVEEEVVVQQHLERERRAHGCFKDAHLRVGDVICVLVYFMLPQMTVFFL